MKAIQAGDVVALGRSFALLVLSERDGLLTCLRLDDSNHPPWRVGKVTTYHTEVLEEWAHLSLDQYLSR